jgi:tetratricopeptide (TPR) repeat protein
MRLAESLDPLSLRTKTLTSWTLYQARQFEEALEIGRQIVDLDANYPQGYAQMGNNLLALGRVEEAVTNFRKFDRMIPDSALAKYMLCHALAAAGRAGEARRVLEEIKTLAAAGYVKPYFLGMAHAALDERDEAFANFEKACSEDDPWMLWFGTEPMLDRLRDDARLDRLLRRMNLPVLKKGEGGRAASMTGEPAKGEEERPDSRSSPEIQSKLAGEAPSGQNSIAVLPLKVMGGGSTPRTGEKSSEEFLGVGLTDTLIMKFSQLERFVVRPTSSIMRFHGRDFDPFEAGRELGVHYVLEGNLRRANGNLRVTLRLLDVAKQATVWSEQFNGAACDIFVLEDEISEQVAKSLLPQISTEEHRQLCKHGTENTEAYEYYLRGRFHWNQFSLEGFSQAFAFYQRAVEIAPDYALAYAGIADYYNFLGIYSVLPFTESAARGKEYALRALTLDPAVAEAYTSLGIGVLLHDFDWKGAERNFRRALELNPNYALGRVWFCYFLGMQKRFDEAFEQIEEALRLDSMTPIVPQTLNWTLYYARRYTESIAATERLLAREPNYGLSHTFLSLVLSTVGRFDEAISAAKKAVRLLSRSPYTLSRLAAAYAAAGRREETEQVLEELREISNTRYVSPYLVATVYANLGERERAFADLERALSIRDGRLVWLGVDPSLDSLRQDARFQNLLRETNHPLAESF